MDAAGFRQVFPQFTQAKYPDASVNFWLNLANVSLLPEVWGDLRDYGVALYVAHNLWLNSPKYASDGVTPLPVSGDPVGLVGSKSVGSVSKSVDYSASRQEGGGTFNLTTYGQQYLTLASRVTTGVLQL